MDDSGETDTYIMKTISLLTATLAAVLTAMILVVSGCSRPNSGSGPAWHITSVDTAGDIGTYSSIALGAGGHPHISYSDDTNKDLKFVCWNGFSWVGFDNAFGPDSVGTAGNTGIYTSLALDGDGYPRISYLDYSIGALFTVINGGSSLHALLVLPLPVLGIFSSALLPGFSGPESSVLFVDLPPSVPSPLWCIPLRFSVF